MIRINADQFARELQRDAEALAKRIVEAENALALDLLNECRENTPVRTGKLKAGWGIAVGTPDATAPGGGEGLLNGRLPQQPIFVQNNDFRASFLENGTVKMSPRPMAAPAIEKLDKRVIPV